MQLEGYRTIFTVICLIGIILFVSPTFALLVEPPPETEPFSAIYLLGPNHTLEDIPFDIQVGVQYTVYLGVRNTMGESSYYTCNVKLRNEAESLPEKTLGIPSSLSTLYQYKQFIGDGKSWESPLNFKISNVSFFEDKIVISNVTINGLEYNVNKVAYWNTEKDGYYFGLFVELWIFNPVKGDFQFSNRAVSFPLRLVQDS